MIERPNPDDESALPEDPAPGSEPAPRFPKPAQVNPDARPETPAKNTKVTPLDNDKNIEKGIEVNET